MLKLGQELAPWVFFLSVAIVWLLVFIYILWVFSIKPWLEKGLKAKITYPEVCVVGKHIYVRPDGIKYKFTNEHPKNPKVEMLSRSSGKITFEVGNKKQEQYFQVTGKIITFYYGELKV